jgi:hypothetical protein
MITLSYLETALPQATVEQQFCPPDRRSRASTDKLAFHYCFVPDGQADYALVS